VYTRENPGNTAVRNMKNPRTRIYTSLCSPNSGFDETLDGHLSLMPLDVYIHTFIDNKGPTGL